MSIKLMSQVWDVQSLSQPRKMLMLAVADFANEEGLSWPSVETLMRKCGFRSDSGVRRALSELCDEGWLIKSTRSSKAPNGRRVQGSNYYQIVISKLLAEASEPVRRAASNKKPDPAQHEGSQHESSHDEGSQHEGSCGNKKGAYEPVPRAPDPSVTTTPDPSVDQNPSCPPASQTDREVEITDLAKLVLTHLNQVTGSKFQVCKSSIENIRARIGEGYTVEELKVVVDYKHEHWNGTEQYQYMRPATLFIPKNFPGYLQFATKWNSSGRPSCVNGKWASAGKTDAFKASYDDVDYSQIPDGFRGYRAE